MRTGSIKSVIGRFALLQGLLQLRFLFILIILVAFLITRSVTVTSRVLGNMGVVLLNQALAGNEKDSIPQLLGQSEAWLKTATELREQDNFARRSLGSTLLAQGRDSEAITAWNEVGQSPAMLFVVRGNRARSEERYEKALSSYEHAVELDPTLTEVWYSIGQIGQEVGQTELAIDNFREAWSLGDANSGNDLARLLYGKGDYISASDIWREALETYPDNPQRLLWWQWLALSLRAGKQWTTALRTAYLALAEFPDNAQLHVELGQALFNADGNVDGAFNEFQKAILLDASLPSAYAATARIMSSEQRYDEAYSWYSKALEQEPNNISWLLGRANVARGAGDLNLAISLYLNFISEYPDYSPAYYEASWAHRKNDDPKSAVETIERAMQLAENPSEALYLRAGAIYEWTGEKEKALSAYENVLSLDKSNELAREGKARLQSP